MQNFHADVAVKTVEGAEQKIPQGPVASQEAIKELGTNGGGFFNANSAHPYENPTPGTNFLQIVLIFAIGAGLTNTLGRMTGSRPARLGRLRRDGGDVPRGRDRVHGRRAARQPDPPGGGSRVGADRGRHRPATWRARRSGSASATRRSSPPSRRTRRAAPSTRCTTPSRAIGGLVPLANIATGEVIFGGVGAGLYGIFLFIVLTVFIAGLMVGRTPEYLGKKIESHEVKLAMLSVLVLTLSILGFSAVASVVPAGLSSLNNKGPHGFSEILYAFTSGAGNNGSAFAGLNANTLFYNSTLGVDMFLGRFFMLIPILGIAGSLAAKKRVPASAGIVPRHGPALQRPARRRDRDRRRADLLPRLFSRTDRRAPADAVRDGLLGGPRVTKQPQPARSSSIARSSAPPRSTLSASSIRAFRRRTRSCSWSSSAPSS